MMQSEFDALLGNNVSKPSDEEYKLIEFVYNWHPCNFSKEAVASLYTEFGIMIFEDMKSRAVRALDADHSLKEAEARLKRCQDNIEEIQRYIKEGCKEDYE